MSLTSAAFVERVRVALGARNANDLSDKLGLKSAGGQRVSRWLKGESQPDYEGMMAMLTRTGWLRLPEDDSGEQPAPLDDPLLALEAQIDQLGRQTAEGFRRLEAGIARVEKRLPPEAQQAQEGRAD